MNDGSGVSFGMSILDIEKFSVLEFECGDGSVRFELTPKTNGCLLQLQEFFPTLSQHTAKDLSGWHICLNIMKALMNAEYMDFPKEEWEKVFVKYQNILNRMIFGE